MKLLQLLVFSFLLATAASKRLLCGPVTSVCISPLPNGKCPKVPFCPGNVKRVLVNGECCCSFTQVTDQPPSVEFSKAKIIKETLEKIEVNYLKARLDIDAIKTADKKEKTSEIIDRASKSISDAMVEGMKRLAELVGVDYFDVLPQIFGDDEAEKSVRGQEIVAEVKEIYEKGEEYLEKFQKISNQ